MKVVEFFSGLGGFSQAFVDRGHNVTRYDNDSRFSNVPYTIKKDVWNLTHRNLKGAKIILASPPCTHFSVAAVYHHWPNGEPTEATKEQIKLILHTIEIIEEAEPDYYIIENPRGMLRNVIGRPQKTIPMCAYGKEAYKPTDLWGKFPPIDWKMPMKWQKAPRGSKLGVQGYDDPAKSALIPYDFSLAVCLAAEGNSPQTIIQDFSEVGP
jgi:hypothetical protein